MADSEFNMDVLCRSNWIMPKNLQPSFPVFLESLGFGIDYSSRTIFREDCPAGRSFHPYQKIGEFSGGEPTVKLVYDSDKDSYGHNVWAEGEFKSLLAAIKLRNLIRLNHIPYEEPIPAQEAVREFLRTSGLQQILDEKEVTK
ncbi:MAG: hypothetical protein AABX11_02365 [Nanoarchaeota archaeon]